ncbi:hypothetical protein [Methylobacterium sp. 1030]|uniref:hypothetical protein n=1 Tax=Methylobacterium sp. 1030 TaxID=3156404 RepID=UPI003392BF08
MPEFERQWLHQDGKESVLVETKEAYDAAIKEGFKPVKHNQPVSDDTAELQEQLKEARAEISTLNGLLDKANKTNTELTAELETLTKANAEGAKQLADVQKELKEATAAAAKKAGK